MEKTQTTETVSHNLNESSIWWIQYNYPRTFATYQNDSQNPIMMELFTKRWKSNTRKMRTTAPIVAIRSIKTQKSVPKKSLKYHTNAVIAQLMSRISSSLHMVKSNDKITQTYPKLTRKTFVLITIDPRIQTMAKWAVTQKREAVIALDQIRKSRGVEAKSMQMPMIMVIRVSSRW